MKDELGLFYYPFPSNRRVRMYVEDRDDMIWFRLWNADDPNLWDEHGWVPYAAVQKAMDMYEGKGFDPGRAYDLQIAMAVLEEHRNDSDGRSSK